MPFYEYQCKSCGHELEAMQKISDGPLKKCPHCGKSQLQRLISAPVFRLKGAGWYETDFKNDKDKKRNLADSADADSAKESTAKPEKEASTADTAGEKSAAKEPESTKKSDEKAAKPASKSVKKSKPKTAATAKKKSPKTRKR